MNFLLLRLEVGIQRQKADGVQFGRQFGFFGFELAIALGGAASVSPTVLPALIEEAIVRWESAGISPEQSGRLRGATVRLVDLADGLLGKTRGNTILIDGYYDKVQSPLEEDMPLINTMLASTDEKNAMQALGIERWVDGETLQEAQMDYLYNPTLNIDGIWAGYTGEGTKTILPHLATAKVDSRLPPGLDPDEMMGLIRTHLDKHGFSDIIIRPMSGYPASQTTLDSELVQAAISVFNKYGTPPSVEPRVAGSAPFYVFTDILKLPMVFTGIGHGSGAHAPNEIMVIYPKDGSEIAGLAKIEKGYVDILHALASL